MKTMKTKYYRVYENPGDKKHSTWYLDVVVDGVLQHFFTISPTGKVGRKVPATDMSECVQKNYAKGMKSEHTKIESISKKEAFMVLL